MTVWIRRALIALAVLLALVAAGLAWFAATFDANRYKGLAIDWMKANRNRVLAIDGPVELSVFPRLAVKVSRLTLSEPASAETFAGIDHAALAVAVWPLLRGEVAIGRVEAKGVRIQLLRDAKGRRNIDDLLSAPAAAGAGAAPGRPMRFDISAVAVEDLRLRVKDAQQGFDGELLVKELRSGRIADGVETPVRLVAQIGLTVPSIKGELTGSARLTPSMQGAGSLRLAEMDLAFKGDAPGASAIDAAVQGALGWNSATGAVDANALRIALAAHTAGMTLAGSKLSIDRFGYDPQHKTIAIADLKLRLRGTQAGEPLELDLDWPALDVKASAISGSAFSGKFSRGGSLPVAASFKSGAPGGSFDAVRIPAFDASLRSDTAQRKVGGTLRANLSIEPQRKTVAFEAIDLRASVEDRGLKPVALNLGGKAGVSAQAANWSLAGQLNANRFDLDGNADLSGTTPLVRAQARFDALDLNAFLPAPGAGGTGARPAADTAIDLTPLRSVNGSFGLRAASLAVRQYRIRDARIDAVLDAGMLRVNNLQARLWGGAVEGSAFADARASRVALKLVGSGVDINALLHDVAGKDFLEGRGRVAADIESAGRSTNEMRSRLRGTASLQLRDGAVKGINLAKTLRQARAALTQRQDHVQKANQVEKTDFSELNAGLQIADGVAHNKDLDLKSPLLRLSGEGLADIGKGRIDYTVRATVADTLKGQDGADLAALRGLTVPVRLTGPFDAIDWHIQWSGVAAALVRNRLEDKLKERLGIGLPGPAASAPSKPKDVLRETLKGLFK